MKKRNIPINFQLATVACYVFMWANEQLSWPSRHCARLPEALAFKEKRLLSLNHTQNTGARYEASGSLKRGEQVGCQRPVGD